MYQVDERDQVVRLQGVPKCDTGAPCPVVLADESRVAVAYFLSESAPAWDGKSVQVVNPISTEEAVGLIVFDCGTHYFGPPNDEVFYSHPLAKRGLLPYGAFEVTDSSWIREMERRNSIHPRHTGGWLKRYRHIILTFHDSILECVAASFTIEQTRGSPLSLVPRMSQLISRR